MSPEVAFRPALSATACTQSGDMLDEGPEQYWRALDELGQARRWRRDDAAAVWSVWEGAPA